MNGRRIAALVAAGAVAAAGTGVRPWRPPAATTRRRGEQAVFADAKRLGTDAAQAARRARRRAGRSARRRREGRAPQAGAGGRHQGPPQAGRHCPRRARPAPRGRGGPHFGRGRHRGPSATSGRGGQGHRHHPGAALRRAARRQDAVGGRQGQRQGLRRRQGRCPRRGEDRARRGASRTAGSRRRSADRLLGPAGAAPRRRRAGPAPRPRFPPPAGRPLRRRAQRAGLGGRGS